MQTSPVRVEHVGSPKHEEDTNVGKPSGLLHRFHTWLDPQNAEAFVDGDLQQVGAANGEGGVGAKGQLEAGDAACALRPAAGALR